MYYCKYYTYPTCSYIINVVPKLNRLSKCPKGSMNSKTARDSGNPAAPNELVWVPGVSWRHCEGCPLQVT